MVRIKQKKSGKNCEKDNRREKKMSTLLSLSTRGCLLSNKIPLGIHKGQIHFILPSKLPLNTLYSSLNVLNICSYECCQISLFIVDRVISFVYTMHILLSCVLLFKRRNTCVF